MPKEKGWGDWFVGLFANPRQVARKQEQGLKAMQERFASGNYPQHDINGLIAMLKNEDIAPKVKELALEIYQQDLPKQYHRDDELPRDIQQQLATELNPMKPEGEIKPAPSAEMEHPDRDKRVNPTDKLPEDEADFGNDDKPRGPGGGGPR